MSEEPRLTARLADAKRALDAADRVVSDGDGMIYEGQELSKRGREKVRSADPQYWLAARLVYQELAETSVTQQSVADALGRSRSMVSKLYSIGKAYRSADPVAQGHSFASAYRAAQEVSDYGIGRLKIHNALDEGPRTQAELAASTGLAQSTISEYLATMVKAGDAQKAAGRPARYELPAAPEPSSEVPAEQPIPEPGPGTHARPEPQPEPEPAPLTEEGRQHADAESLIRYLQAQVREIKAGRLAPDPSESGRMVTELSAITAALRDRADITALPRDQWPEASAVGEALKSLAKTVRWASTAGQHAYFTDGATVWVVIANTRCAIVKTRNDKVTVHPSDVTAHWLLTKATQ
jgi:Bacterial regulatory protein, arsR family